MELALTGHRPDKLGGYAQEVEDELYLLAFDHIQRMAPERVHCGMALGWDMAGAYACLDLGIPYVAHVPFDGQESKWAKASQDAYFEMLDRAETILVYAPSFDFAAFHRRDEGMVDCSQHVLAMWNGIPKGGTHHTVRYATRVGVPVTNLWPEWESIWETPSSNAQNVPRISQTLIDGPVSRKKLLRRK